MDNQKGEYEKVIDLSQFSIKEKEVISSSKRFKLKSFKQFWQKTSKKNKIFIIIIIVAFILTIILLFSLLNGRKNGENIIPTSYPSAYPLSAEKGGI